MFQDMSAWTDINSKLKKAFEYVKQNPILDTAAKSLLQEIPVVGGFLVKLYERAGPSEEDKNQVILKSIEQLIQLNEEQFNKISKELNENRDTIIENIIENKIVVTDLISKSVAQILEEIRTEKAELADKINSVKEAFSEIQIKNNLSREEIMLFTAETEINPGEKDCWINGYFTDKEIKSGYDARIPLTDKIIESVENNYGTIVYGDPYTGKSILLKRIMLELIQKGYVVLYGDGIEIESILLKQLLSSVYKKYSKLVFISDNAHKSSSETVFRVFNDIKPNEVRFLFAARERQLQKTRDEIRIALRKIPPVAQYRIDFDMDIALLFCMKAIHITFQRNPTNSEIELSNRLFENSKGDPLMFNLGLRNLLTEVDDEIDFIERAMDKWIEKIRELNNQKFWNAAIGGSLCGMTDLPLSLSESKQLLDCCDFTSGNLRVLSNEGVLFKEPIQDSFRIRHEIFAYEFLSHLYKNWDNSEIKFNKEYGSISEVLKCILQNTTANEIIDFLNTCSYLHINEKYRELSELIISNYVNQANEYISTSSFSEKEKARLYCFGFGSFYFSIGNYTSALVSYDKALEINEKYFEALGSKGATLSKLGRHKEALEYYGKAMAIYSNDITLLSNVAHAYLDLNRIQEAIEWYDRALEIDSTKVILLNDKAAALCMLDRNEEAIVLYDKAIAIDSKNFAPLDGRGWALINLGRNEEAIKWLDRALEINSKNVDVIRHKAFALNKLGRNEEAIKWLDRALEINSKDIVPLTGRALILSDLGRKEEALIWFDKVLAIDRKNIGALSGKGAALSDLGRKEEAIIWFDKVLAIDSNDLNALYMKSLAVNDLVIAKDGKNVNALYSKGATLGSLGMHEEAIEWFDKVLQINNKNINALNGKGSALINLGRNEEAIKWLDRALEIDCKYVYALAAKGLALANLRKEEAFIWLDKALALDPNNPYLLGVKSQIQQLISMDKKGIYNDP